MLHSATDQLAEPSLLTPCQLAASFHTDSGLIRQVVHRLVGYDGAAHHRMGPSRAIRPVVTFARRSPWFRDEDSERVSMSGQVHPRPGQPDVRHGAGGGAVPHLQHALLRGEGHQGRPGAPEGHRHPRPRPLDAPKVSWSP